MSRRGFTLLELVVASGIFSLALLIATGLFTSTTRAQKRIQSLAKVQGDARYVLDLMAASARSEGIDYGYYGDPNNDGSHADLINLSTTPTDRLVTFNGSGRQTFFRWLPFSGTQTKLGICTVGAGGYGDCDQESEYLDITPTGNTITRFQVYLFPASDPFQSAPTADRSCVTNLPAGPGVYGFAADREACTCGSATDCFPGQVCDSGQGICRVANEQPRVTMVITTRGGSSRSEEQFESTFQTSVSIRSYKR